MSNNWQKVRLGDVIKFNPLETLPRCTLAKKISMEHLLPYTRQISGYEISSFSGGSKFRNGDTLMARITPCLENGKTAQVDILDENETAFGSTEFIVLREIEGISDNNFIYYLAGYPNIRDIAIKSMMGTSGRQRVQQDVLENMVIALPPLPIQRIIAKILSILDDKIELNRKINDYLEQIAQAVFKSWFVDFEPRGGKKPSNWTVGKAENFFDISIGKTPPRKEPQWFTTNPQDVVWASISDMGGCGMFISDSSEYLTAESVSRFNVQLVPSGTVLLSFKLTVGRVAITDGEMTTNEAIAHFKNSNMAMTEYLYCYLKTFDYQLLGNTSSIGNAVNSKTIKAMPFVMPDEKSVIKFHSITFPLFHQIRYNLKQSRALVAIRDILLPKLMSGEINVTS